jgi:uncharacterized protein (DUF1800 family)
MFRHSSRLALLLFASALGLAGPGATSVPPQAPARAPTSAPWDARAAEHLLNRAAFGATGVEVDAAIALGREAFLARLFTGTGRPRPAFELSQPERPSREERRAMSEEERRRTYQRLRRADNEQLLSYTGWWFDGMVSDEHPLRERMVLFWHGFFTSSAREVKNGEAMIRQNQLFRAHALGSYAELLHAIVRDPAMLVYLNNTKNTRAAPNENLARELMELFSLGEGHYTEQDVKEAARALTGYTQLDANFVFNRRQHDGGTKTVLGVTGELDADRLVDILLAQDACPRWVAGKLLEHFEGRVPPAPRVERYAKVLRAANWRIDAFLGTLFDDPEFYSPEVVGQRIVGPVEFMVANCRRLEVLPPGGVLAAGASLLGQQVFGPPNVKGWDGGRGWITTSTFLQRGNIAGMLLGVTRLEDIFKEDPDLFGAEDSTMEPSMDDESMGGDEPMEPAPGPTGSTGTEGGRKPRQDLGGGRGVSAGLRLMEAPRWRRELDLRGRLKACGAGLDAELVDQLGKDLLAVELSPEARQALVEYLRAERTARDIAEGRLLDQRAYGEAILRQLAHLILSLPEAQLN